MDIMTKIHHDSATEIARANLAAYDARDGLTSENNLTGTWDLMQAAKLAENVRSLLGLIEKLNQS